MAQLIETNDGQVWATEQQAQAIEVLKAAAGGSFAAVKGYVPESNWKVSPVQNIQFISRFSYARLNARRRAAVESVTFDMVQDAIAAEAKLAALTEAKQREVFDARKASIIASIDKTAAGDRSDAHRQAHDRNYRAISPGVKVNLETDVQKEPVMVRGYPVAKSIMVSAIFLNVKTVREGVRKVVNSGAPVLMGKAIETVVNKKSIMMRTLALKDGNFESISIGGETLVPEDVRELFAA